MSKKIEFIPNQSCLRLFPPFLCGRLRNLRPRSGIAAFARATPLAEFDFRYNNRSELGCEDTKRADIVLKGIIGKRLTYRGTDSSQGPDSKR